MQYRKDLIALIMIIAMVLISCGQDQPQETKSVIQPAKVMTLQDASGEIRRRFPGTVRASHRVDLAFQVSGRLVEFPVKEGQKVEKGQLLGKLDNRDYQSTYNAAQADVKKNKSNFARAEELIVKDFISRMDYDRIKAALDISVSNLEKAKKALDDTKMVAPFTGSVARTYVQNFEDVLAKQQILSLQDKTSLEIVVNVSETLIARRTEGGKLELTARFDAIPEQSFDLFIKEFATEADPTTQTFQYVLGIEDLRDNNILPGMTATVFGHRQSTAQSDQGHIIPLTALASGTEGESSVWVVDEKNLVHKRSITLGELSGSDSVKVMSGLNPGDRIVIGGTANMYEGREIKPIDKVIF